jgi:hypothetical protein
MGQRQSDICVLSTLHATFHRETNNIENTRLRDESSGDMLCDYALGTSSSYG